MNLINSNDYFHAVDGQEYSKIQEMLTVQREETLKEVGEWLFSIVPDKDASVWPLARFALFVRAHIETLLQGELPPNSKKYVK